MSIVTLLIIIIFCKDIYSFNYSDTKLHKISFTSNTQKFHKDKKQHPDLSGWTLGGQGGFYFSGNATANYYKGEGKNEIRFLLYNDWFKQRIKEELEGYDFSNIVLPENMKYQPAFWIGFFAKLSNKNGSGTFIEFNFAKLTSSDKFTIEVERYNGGIKQPYVKICDIYGVEERININLGYSFCLKTYPYKPFFQIGANINNVKVKEHKIKIGNFESSIMNPIDMYYNIPQGGIGYGLFAGTGIQLFLNKVSIDPGFDIYYKKINLTENPKFDWHFCIYMRFSSKIL